MSLASEVKAVARTLGQRIRMERMRRQWTTHQLARRLDVPERVVRRAEEGQTSLSLETYLKACVLLGVDLTASLETSIAEKRGPRSVHVDILPSEVDF